MSDDEEQPEAAGEAAEENPSPVAKAPSFPLVVGVGASVTDQDSLTGFLAGLDGDESALIVCLVSQEAAEEKALLKRLAKITGRRAIMAQDGAQLETHVIYLVPAASVVTVSDGHLAVRPSPEPLGQRGRIDSLLVSLARAQGEHAVGIVLAGVGGDGTLGAAAMKEQGGLVIAQETETNIGHSTLTNGAAASIADYVLPAARIAECVIRYRLHLAGREGLRDAEAEREQITGQLNQIATVLRNKTGHDFHGYKQNTFLRRVQRRMQVTRNDDVETYIGYLRDNPDEVQSLFNDMLIGVTQFFRDAKEFELLEQHVIPKLFEGKNAADQVRVWVLGCATGEEAYSLAILLREKMATLDVVPNVQIFATDIDGRALASARVGRFAETIARDVSPERLARWFIKEGDTYCVVKELREMCIFSQHNLIKDAPFSRLDLVSCRNLLIYLDNDLQNRVIPLFHFSLLRGGHLFLGNSENVTRHAKLFAPIDRRFRIFRKLETSARVLPDFPLSATADRQRGEVGPRPRMSEGNLARRAERIAERYSPAYAVVDEQHEALHFSGRTGRFLEPATGVATLNLLNLVHRDLRLDLRAALHKAAAENSVVKTAPLRMGTNGDAQIVSLIVEPVNVAPGEHQHFMVIFQAGETVAEESTETAAAPLLRDEHVQRLESELRITRERLQATIEELESTNEELKSSNEEYQSINEELQSANEELETGKEELQSVNEELQTVNGELAHRVQELDRANSDLKNLLESTQIATVFLDNDLRVRNFTPALTEIFHLIDSDLGRPITHIGSKINYEDLAADVRRVLRTLTTVEREIGDPRSGARYLVRILPYRSVENFIGGVVLTFLDITKLANAEQALRESEERFRRMASAVPIVLFTALPDLRPDYINDRFYALTGLPDGSAPGHGWLAAVHPDDVERVQSAWEQASDTGTPLEVDLRVRSAKGYRWMLMRAEAARDASGKIVRWFGSASDINDLRLATERQTMLMAELQHRVKNILAVVRSIYSRTFEASGDLNDIANHFRGRLDAFARTQTVLARTAGGGVDLEELIRDELLSVGARMDGPKVKISGKTVRLAHKEAEALGLAVHELATNAIKYGALAQDDARIEIAWKVEGKDERRLHFQWQEKGVRIVSGDAPRKGFGSELIEQGLPYQLGAATALQLEPGGVRCAINLPLMDTVTVPVVPLLETNDEDDP